MPGGPDVFRDMDPALWERSQGNPRAMIETVPPHRLKQLGDDPGYVARVAALAAQLEADLRRPPIAAGIAADRPVAYFCSEFGVHHSLPLYGGGLGVLAGDVLKAASDLAVPMVGVGAALPRGLLPPAARPVRMAARMVDDDRVRAPAGRPRHRTGRSAPDRRGHDARSGGAHPDLAPRRRPGAALPAGHRPRGQPPDRPVDHGAAVHRRPAHAADPVRRPRRRRRTRAGSTRHPALHRPSERGARGAWRRSSACARSSSPDARPRRPWHSSGRRPSSPRTRPLRRATNGTRSTRSNPSSASFAKGSMRTGRSSTRSAASTRRQRTRTRSPPPPLALRTSRASIGVSRRHGEVARGMWRRAVAGPTRARGAHRPRDQRRAHRDLDGRTDAGVAGAALGPDWRTRLADPALWERIAAIPDAELWAVQTRPPAGARRVRAGAVDPRPARARRVAGVRRGGGARLRPRGPHDRLRAPGGDLQAPAPLHASARPRAPAARGRRAPDPGRARRQGAPPGRGSQAGAPGRVRAAPRPARRKPHRVPGRLRSPHGDSASSPASTCG